MKNKYAIIVVDMLNDFVSGSIAHPRIKHIIEPIKELCDKARAAGVPVIYANDSHTPEVDKEFKVWGPHAVEGTWGAEVIDELKPQKGDYIIPRRLTAASSRLQWSACSGSSRSTPSSSPDGRLIAAAVTHLLTHSSAVSRS